MSQKTKQNQGDPLEKKKQSDIIRSSLWSQTAGHLSRKRGAVKLEPCWPAPLKAQRFGWGVHGSPAKIRPPSLFLRRKGASNVSSLSTLEPCLFPQEDVGHLVSLLVYLGNFVSPPIVFEALQSPYRSMLGAEVSKPGDTRLA